MILTIVTLCGLYFALAFAVERGRSRNLDLIACDFRDQMVEAYARLDDAQRNCDHWQARTDALLLENSTLLVDLTRTEQRNQYLESLHRQRKGETAGVLLTEFVINPKRKMTVWKVGAP